MYDGHVPQEHWLIEIISHMDNSYTVNILHSHKDQD